MSPRRKAIKKRRRAKKHQIRLSQLVIGCDFLKGQLFPGVNPVTFDTTQESE